MKTARMLTILVVALGLVLCRAKVSEAEPMGTGFTYQGHLYDANRVADGLYDFVFKLYDGNDPCDANEIGGDVNKPDVDVADGYFTVALDFGSVFMGDDVWLHVGVRPGELEDPNGYTTLRPLQEITAVPYALTTRGIYVDGFGNVGLSTTAPTEKLHVNGNININSVYKIGGQTTLSVAGMNNTLVGGDAGANNTGTGNTFLGTMAGINNTTGSSNTFVGCVAGLSNTTANNNTFLGRDAGNFNTTGKSNTFLGKSAGYYNTTGVFNTFSGLSAGYSNTTGYRNTFLGMMAGYSNTTGGGNVFVGYKAGYNETGDNKLYIANGPNDVYVLIYGDFNTGRVGIGTTDPCGTLDVNGPIYQRGSSLHADYVFEDGYELESIEEHSEIMWSERHLPAIPKAKRDETGREIVEVGAHRKGIVEELEKAHIYIEQLHNGIKELKEQNRKMESRLAAMEGLVGGLSRRQEGGI